VAASWTTAAIGAGEEWVASWLGAVMMPITGFLAKPFRADELLAAVNVSLED
jgi:hypothetical protein